MPFEKVLCTTRSRFVVADTSLLCGLQYLAELYDLLGYELCGGRIFKG